MSLDRSDMIRELNQLSWKLYTAGVQNGSNAILSPHSICSALMLACLGAGGETKTQILTTLGFGAHSTDSEKLHSDYAEVNAELTRETNANKDLVLTVANKIFATNGIVLLPGYTEKSEKLYQSGVVLMDFANKSEECRKDINKWVEEQTCMKIQDLLQEGSIVPTTTLVLANAVYFKGKWDKPFTADKTKEADFYVTATETVKVEMMHEKIDARCTEDGNLKYSTVSIPYQGKSMSMVIVLPDSVDGLSGLLQKIDVEKIIENIRQSFVVKVELALPKFRLTETTNLSRVLPQLGITDLFDVGKCDLCGMTDAAGLSFSDVIHKAYIEVTEEGTEAAAATAMISRMMLMPMGEKKFICDHPFLFMIVDNHTDLVLFLGCYQKP